MAENREFDIIVYGATGFTGRLVAEYLAAHYSGGDVRWAMAGRSADKLGRVRDEIGASPDTPLVVADSEDPASIDAMAQQASVIISTVGPFQLYGSELVAACAKAGTGYVDLCGEPNWMRAMIDAHEGTAKASGARIVFSCGFDSIPFDLGVWHVQRAARERCGVPAARVKGRVKAMKGTFSGGTAASMKATMAAGAKDPSVLKLMTDPFALTPGHEGPEQPKGLMPYHDASVDAWVAPFVMAIINTKNVHRTNYLAGQPYGADFRYDEMMMVPGIGEAGKRAAEALAQSSMIGGKDSPKPGEGPSRQERDNGYYELLFVAECEDGRQITATVKGDRDPGYGSTSKMIAEAAICLLRDVPQDKGGIWTPGALMAEPLTKRLEANAGLTFTVS